jgi:hypothetical protein
MRVSKILGSLLAVGVALVATTAATESRAGGDEDLLGVTCDGGNVTVSVKAPWHANKEAPWKWDKGEKKKLEESKVTFSGAKCEGTLKAFICNGDQCKGPIPIKIK